MSQPDPPGALEHLIADRTRLIDASGIRKVFDLAATMTHPINLSIGQPDFDVPDDVKAAAVKAIEDGFNRYTQTQGIAELAERFRVVLKAKHDYEPESVLITSGVSGGLLLSLMALVNPGDEVIFPDPYFVMYKHLVNLVGGTPVPLDTYDSNFQIDPARLEAALTPRTKVLIINSPCNPTGVVVETDVLREIAEIARKHGLFVVTDEIYDAFVYRDEPMKTIATMVDNVLWLGGLAKSHAFTGWRLGFACGPDRLIQEMAKIQQYTFVCAPSMVQRAAIVALDCDVSHHVAAYRRKRDLLYDALADSFDIVKPEGAFYMFPKVPSGTDMDFVTRAVEKNLLIIPGSVFSEKTTHFRIAYATDDDTLLRAADILKSL